MEKHLCRDLHNHHVVFSTQDAQRVLAPVKKDMRGCNKELADAVKALEEIIARHLTKAERENATVYLQVCCHILM